MLSLAQHDVEFEGYRLRTFQGGTGRPLLLLHGTGPGTSTAGNFARIIDRLSERYSVLAADLIGFGFSDRKKDLPYFDFELWSRQAQFLLDLLPGNDVCVFGHSLSGALALKLAIENDRVTRVLTTGTLGTRFPINKSLELTWTYPDSREAVIETTKALVYDRSIITESFLDNRMELLQTPGYKEYFGKMFEVDHQFLIDSACLGEELLNGISADVLMMHGREDRPVPANQTSLVLGGMIRNCDVTVIGQCGHSPSMEHPEKVLSAAMQLFN
jgi:2-hydroxymuconate-semialdehyde hydrolase